MLDDFHGDGPGLHFLLELRALLPELGEDHVLDFTREVELGAEVLGDRAVALALALALSFVLV